MKKSVRFCALVMSVALICGTAPVSAADDGGAVTFLNFENTCNENYSSVVDITDAEYTYDEMQADIRELLERFPDKLRVENIGKSELSRDLPVLIIGNKNAESRYFALGGSHAREYIATVLLMKNVEFYLQNYDNTAGGQKLSDLFEQCEFYFMPMHNPDGIMLVQEGLDSLNVITDPERRKEYEKKLLPLMNSMNRSVSKNWAEQDTEWIPPGENETDFQYWKSNINGIDDHYNFWDAQMMNWLKAGSFLQQPANSIFTSEPSYMSFMDKKGVTQAEVKAVADYCEEKQFNVAMSYHILGSIYQWNYGFLKEENGAEKQKKAEAISTRMADFMGHSISSGYSAHIGFNGWYRNSFPNAYCANIELAARDYFKDVPGYQKWENDAAPVKIEQFTTDLTTKSGVNRYAIWTKHKFTPIYEMQYLIANKLVVPAGKNVLAGGDETPVTGVVNAPDPDPTIPPPETATALPSNSKIVVDGVALTFEAYNIGGANYFKLRDVAMAMNTGKKPFNVLWDEARDAISLVPGAQYKPLGNELVPGDNLAKAAALSDSKLYLDEKKLDLYAYNIGGANYFKLRDLALALDFGVGWDGDLGVITVDSGAGYTA